MSNVLVTVIIPAYNHERFIEESIRSVINQDYCNIELVIINDGSKDRTHDIILSMMDECQHRFSRFEYIDKNNEGVAVTLNKGIEWSNAKYITALASDDLMKPNKVSLLLSVLANTGSDVGFVYADADFINDNNELVGLDKRGNYCSINEGYISFIEYYTRKRSDIILGVNSFTYEVLLKGNFIPAMSVMWKRTALEQVGLFTPNIIIEDWDLWLKMVRVFKGVYLPSIVASYRWHENNTVKKSEVKILQAIDYMLMNQLEILSISGDKKILKVITRSLLINVLRLVRVKKYKFLLRFFDFNVVKYLF